MLQEGAAIWPSNLGGVTSAVLLWAELYAVTGEQRYLEAARRAAAFSHREWLTNDRWQMHGGEIDSFGLPDSTTAMYAAMGYAALALASGEEAHQAMTRDAANYLVAQQWLFDINYGYYRKEARWNGMDCKTVGALQGWIRPECTMCLYLAFKATGDPLYRYSMEQHAAWMTYMQYDNPDSSRTFGGGHEVFEVPADQINGFGSNFWPETVGQAVAMLLLMADDEARAAAVGGIASDMWPSALVGRRMRPVSVYPCHCTDEAVHEGQRVHSVVGPTGYPQRLSGDSVPQAQAIP